MGDAHVLFNHGFFGAFWGDCMCDDLTRCAPPRLRAWSQEVSAAYLKPFDLLEEGSVMSPPVGTLALQRASEAVKGTKAKVVSMRKDAPYPIIIANCQIDQQLLPLEFTPLYSGVPAAPDTGFSGKVGGGVVESFGIGSPAPASLPSGGTAAKNGEEVTVTPEKFVSLSFAAGASSAAITEGLETVYAPKVVDEALGASQMQIWSPLDIRSKENGSAIVADGGGGGDIAILGLLRRGVKRIIVQLTTTTPVPCVNIDNPVAYQEAKEKYFKNEGYLAGLFGLDYELKPNKHKQVFDANLLDHLFKSAIAKTLDGGSVVVIQKTLSVLANTYYSVPGRLGNETYEVDVMWSFPDMSERFSQNLAPDTKKRFTVPDSSLCDYICGSGITSNFPYNVTTAGNFEPALVRLLAENSAYNVLSGIDADVLEKFALGPGHISRAATA